jgi:FPC/CPF motif-containing protein YcgG
MSDHLHHEIIHEFMSHVKEKEFPCIAAHEALSKNTLRCFVAEHLACPKDDTAILAFIYQFIDEVRTDSKGFHTAAVIFTDPVEINEEIFESLLWKRLQALSDLDALRYPYDPRVDADVNSPNFSFSLKSEAFYVIGMFSQSSRKARRFKYPSLIFNPHAQFEKLRENNQYAKMQHIVRNRDKLYSGTVNPMLADFGEISEVFQYSGKLHSKDWKCPLNPKHAIFKDHSST